MSSSVSPPPPTLPLEWTRIGRPGKRGRNKDDANDSMNMTTTSTNDPKKRSRQNTDENSLKDDANLEYRCCNRRYCRHGTKELAVPNSKNKDNNNMKNAKLLRRRFTGRVIMCWLDLDPDWFHGYFFPQTNNNETNHNSKNNNKPWRLLGTRREVDDCMACAEGGYRLLDVTVYPSSSPTVSTPPEQQQQQQQPQQQQHVLDNVEWLGADMMELSSPYLCMRTERLATEQVAAQMAQKVFSGMLRRHLQREQPNDEREEEENEESLPLKQDAKEGDEEAMEKKIACTRRSTTTTTATSQSNDSRTPTTTWILNQFPDITVVAGSMELYLPITRQQSRPEDQVLYDLLFED